MFASKVGKHSHSQRPLQTITPLADRLGLTIQTPDKKDHFADVAQTAMQTTGVVLVAWEHQDIPGMANVILGNQSAPQKWPGDRFDLVWIFDRQRDGTYAFSQVPQNLLAGDRNQPVAA